MDLPYRAEYAKSGRASCRGCKSIILKGDLRLAAMIQSPAFDGRVPHWYHFDCFFVKQRPTTEDDIAHFESLRWEDQEKIKKQISTLSSIVVPAKKGKKRNAGASLPSQSALIDYFIQYAKSGRSSCRGCEQTIMKDEIRVSKRDFQTDIGKRYGGQDMWHHLTCFAKLRSELGYFECGDSIPGFKTLSIEDQAQVKIELPAIKQETIPEKKIKLEDETDGKSQEKEMKEQNKIMYKYRDQLKELSKSELQKLFDKNNQEIPVGTDRMLDRLSDGMAFGALEKCSTCKEGQLVFNKFGYQCGGNLTEWSKCEIIVKTPKRNRFKIPKELTEKYPFLKKYKYVPRTRIIKDVNPSSSTAVKKEETYTGPKVIRELPPLYNMEFVILLKKRPELKSKITKLGGKISTKVKETVMAVIATANDVDKMGSRITEAMNADVHVVTEDILDEAKEYSGRIPELILKKNICTWGSDPYTRMPEEPSSSKSKSKSTSIFTKSLKSKVKVTVKGGAAVDPDSGLDDVAHIFQEDNVRYTAVLGLTDIQQQKNSYYKLQLLEADSGNKYWLFRAWGRIGTTIGNTKVEKLNLMTAIEEFRRLYEEKTGNMWENRQNFVKVPNRMYPIEINFGDEAEATVNINSDIPTKLPKSIQELIQLIFDVNKMKNLMLEFELDTEKMPLGKLSKAQIQSAYEVLSELQQLVNIQAPSVRFVDASNRFYTFIPHSFGVDNPPIIDSSEMIKKKIEMLDNLMELEVAYNLMKSTGGDNSLDSYYDKLKTEIDILHHESEEFNIIKDYVKNTHAETHSNYELEIQDVFTVKRQGEDKRFKPFRKLNNRKLLWHGSRTTNYAGILSQGLRIAPPEAPVTGYMFGKGIYFADMVSKSANYCCTTPSSNTGLLLLCEVALGEIHELYNAKYIEKLPKGKHSVKGIGKTEPDPSKLIKIANDVEVPIGKGVSLQRSKATSLLYNEYIVYDTAQVNIKYLLKMNFKYKY